FATKARLPAIYPWGEFVDNGGLMSYGPIFAVAGRDVARYVDKILKGAKPADLPVEQPTKFELVINLRTAKALGLTIPPVVLMRAEKVISEKGRVSSDEWFQVYRSKFYRSDRRD